MLQRRSCSTATKSRARSFGWRTRSSSATPSLTRALAIVGIHRRGVHLATRLHAQVAELLDAPVALGSLDISFHRDDLGRRGPDARSCTPPRSTSRSTARPS